MILVIIQLIFVVIGKQYGSASGKDKTIFTYGIDRKGDTLSTALAIFKRHDVNVVAIDSFPNTAGIFARDFFVEIEGHPEDHNVKLVLNELQTFATFLTILGGFPDQS